ncbi:MAG: L-seryl-tRNA(Sec) selenium transferase [Armatimonadetes bacterium]|nr:L-seryl-tRNA(Sec) selenium transferase [Armatimonadota bacterium]
MAGKKLQNLPSVASLIEKTEFASFPHSISVAAARKAVSDARELARDGETPPEAEIAARAVAIARDLAAPAFRPVINASGTILHTGLGRARLAPEAADAVAAAAGSHISLEFDRETGKRGDRQTGLRRLLCRLTGAESALVVNNNAAAVLLTINTLAAGKGVLLSRGQSVEIGGSFRMPDVVRVAGGRLIDVGCTNRTRLSDYEGACDEETAAILRCHPSNFKLVGFVEEPDPKELAETSHRLGLHLIDDVGSGCLVETERFGLPHEPTIAESLAAGADIVTASGDKLLGGPQAGIILGRKELVSRIVRNPMARSVRIGKLTAAGLEATLRLYEEERELEIPTLRYLARPLDEVKRLARRLRSRLRGRGVPASVDKGTCEPGGGSLPGVTLPSHRVSVQVKSAERLARTLRLGSPTVIGYIERDAFWLDMRTVEPEEVPLIEDAVVAAWEAS